MLILPLVNRNRILNVEVKLKNAEKIKTKVNLDNVNESDIVVAGVNYSNSVYNVDDASYNLIVDFIRNYAVKNKEDNYIVTTRESSDSPFYDVYNVTVPPKKVSKELDDLYGWVVTDMRKEIPGNVKGKYISFEKLGIDKHITDDKIATLQTIVKEVEDQSKWPELFEKAGILDLKHTLDFVKCFDCKIISDTTIPEDVMNNTLDIFKKLNTKDYKSLNNYYHIALSNKEIYNKLLFMSKLIYNKPLNLIRSSKDKPKVLVKEYEKDKNGKK